MSYIVNIGNAVGDEDDEKFVANFTEKFIVNKNEILKNGIENVAPMKFSFKNYGNFGFVFIPKMSSINDKNAWLCGIMLMAIDCSPSYEVKYKFSISEDGIKWIKLCVRVTHVSKSCYKFGYFLHEKLFFDEFPFAMEWKEIHFKVTCSFTAPDENNFIDDKNWETYLFLEKYSKSLPRQLFCFYDIKTGNINCKNVDGTVNYVKEYSCEKWHSLPIHKHVLSSESLMFEEMFKASDNIALSAEFKESTVENGIAFCYLDALKSYDEELLKFAKFYEMKNLYNAGDAWFAKQIEQTKSGKYKHLLKKYSLPMLSKVYEGLPESEIVDESYSTYFWKTIDKVKSYLSAPFYD